MLKLFVFLCLATVSLYSSFKEMSLDEKVGQLLIAHFPGKEINEEARILVKEIGVGGIIYYEWANGLDSPQQVQNLSNGLQKLSLENRFSIPLFISADQEGGLVARLKAGFTVFPGNGALGRTGDPHLTELCVYAMGKEMRSVGINLNFSPVVDVNCNENNPVIGIRSFGNCPKNVAEHAKHALEGYSRARVIASLKHFPGHGDVSSDSHESLPIVHKSKEELMAVELYPFQQLAPFADMIMTAHILVPSLDPKDCATFSSPILKDLLRSQLGFQGIIISDSLIMEGVLSQGTIVEEAALRAFNAGCDMLILGGRQLMGQRMHYELTVQDVKKIHRFLVDAVKKGLISEADLDASVERILRLKEKLDLSPITTNDIAACVHTKENQVLSAKIAELSVQVEKSREAKPRSFKLKKIAIFAPSVVSAIFENSSLVQLGKNTQFAFFATQEPTLEEIQKCRAIAKEADAVILCSYNAWRFPQQEELIRSILEICAQSIVISLRDPQDRALFPKASAWITTCSPTAVSLEAAAAKIN